MIKLKIKSGSTVQVIAGADKGKKGKVIEVDRGGLRIKVEGVKIMTHYDRKEGVKKLEGFIDYSNVKLLEAAAPAKAKKSQVEIEVSVTGTKVRLGSGRRSGF